MKKLIALALLITASIAYGLEPAIGLWLVNCDGQTGYNGIEVNVQSVQYEADAVYVSATGVPDHSIGPWGGPNDTTDQGWVYKIPLVPQPAVTPTATPLGAIGAFTNGVAMFNALDARSFNDLGIWNQNAVVAEALGFDSCLGHPTMGGAYHHHQQPTCLRAALGDDGASHSPILGWAFDGYPVYGPYGFSDPMDPGSAARRMDSSYRMRTITQRHELPDGTVLPAGQWGPDVSGASPLGLYVEDFEYVSGLGDLDEYHNRFCVTPEYPEGIFAYFATIDALGESAYPYLVGPEYIGVPEAENIGPGNPTIPGTAVTAELCDFPSTPFCDGSDGALASCPCSNPGDADTGCDIQQGTGGVELELALQQTSPQNRITWSGSGFPAASTPTSIVIRASSLDTGSPVVFGDGLRCVGVPIVRLAATFASGGTVTHVHGHGAMAGSGLAYYQLWFRNTPIMFCDPAAAFNLSSGRTLTW
jgi:hypothetical protein